MTIKKNLMLALSMYVCAGCLPSSGGGNGDGGGEARCGADERVLDGACVACAAGYENAQGDDPTQADTECDPITELGKGRLIPNPRDVAFGPTPIGESSEVTVTLTNVGDTELTVSTVSLAERGDDDLREIALEYGFEDGSVIEPGATQDLLVRWEPANTTSDVATITLGLEDALFEQLVIEVTTPSLEPDVSVPGAVFFPSVAPGEVARELFEIENTGGAPLQLRDVFVSPIDSDFSISFPSPGQESDPESDAASWAPALEPGDSIPVRVTYAPDSNQPDTAEVIISTNDPDSPEVRVLLTANADNPALILNGADPVGAPVSNETHALDFGSRNIGQSHTKTVLIENPGSGTLVIDDVTFSTDGAFSLASTPTLSSGLEIEPGESIAVQVTFSPTDTSESLAELALSSNDQVAGDLLIRITGQGTSAVCPTAIGLGRVAGTNRPYSAAIGAEPLQIIEFDGTQSVGASRYEWILTQTPSGSNARLTPNNTSPNPTLFLDLIGNYTVELHVSDEQGLESCEPSIISILAEGADGYAIQLVWDTPQDPNQTDLSGADLDLHYLNKKGTWNDAVYDIYWMNATADWGVTGDPSDDPQLDIDDSDGAGPENINHDSPSSSEDFSIGVYYYDDHSFGPSYATMRIYVDGVLEFESRDKYLERTDVFWHVVDIDGFDSSIDDVDAIRQGFP